MVQTPPSSLISMTVMEISEEGGVWTIKTSTTLKNMELQFKLNEEFEETTADGRDVKSIVTFEDGKIVTVQTAKNAKHKSTKSIREMTSPDELVYTLTIDGVDDLVCVQKFKRKA